MDALVEMRGITKVFPGITANDNINLQLRKGEIHALLGENGAGKSTLMSVLFGMYQPEAGSIFMRGKPVRINGPNDATRLGIGMVHQHFMLVHNFTVLENIILGVEDAQNGLLEMKRARKKVTEISAKYKLTIDPDARISDITVGMQQRVEILKMLYRENEVLIFDEPTAVLTPQEITELMKIMRGLVAEGKSILFITHKLNEIKAVADRCTVLRKGKCIGTVEVADATPETLSEMMVGRKVSLQVEKPPVEKGKVIFDVKNLTVKNHATGKSVVNNISFAVREGEIVCVAGIEGNGQSELIHAITGLAGAESGVMVLDGDDFSRQGIRHRGLAGMAHIPEDRLRHGLVLDYDLASNLVLQDYFEPRFQRNGFIKKGAVTEYAEKLIHKYDIRSGQGTRTITRSMSGGNQQKTIVARELEREPKLLVAVQPTRGLDVGAIEYIHAQLIKARGEGKAVLLVSLELDEVLNVSDRILVIFEGRIVAEVDPAVVTYQELGLYMAGSNPAKEAGEGA
ncbi:MAG: ABC transporter ATP-binding protein [Clostridiales bacterium]|jgi:simple sugar transport system ATP-binding protein|nr:ABC transporter ATP-binding protein [Clostridiales bacterium]